MLAYDWAEKLASPKTEFGSQRVVVVCFVFTSRIRKWIFNSAQLIFASPTRWTLTMAQRGFSVCFIAPLSSHYCFPMRRILSKLRSCLRRKRNKSTSLLRKAQLELSRKVKLCFNCLGFYFRPYENKLLSRPQICVLFAKLTQMLMTT